MGYPELFNCMVMHTIHSNQSQDLVAIWAIVSGTHIFKVVGGNDYYYLSNFNIR